MKVKVICLFATICLSINFLRAQGGLSYYPFQSEIGINTNSDKRIWGDLRFLTNTFFGNVTIEPALFMNLKKSNTVNWYSGLGVNTNFANASSDLSVINGYTLVFGSRIKPFKNKSILIIGEISPYMNSYFDGGILKTRLGIAYSFQKKN